MAQPQPEPQSIYQSPPPYFAEALEDAERLLKYAAEIGLHIDDEPRDHVLAAQAASAMGWDPTTAANLFSALEILAAKVKPVTAASLKVCAGRPTVRKYWIVSICLAVIIILFSVASFVTSAISTTMKADILAANDLAVKLRTQLGPPDQPGTALPADRTKLDPIVDGTVLAELQQF